MNKTGEKLQSFIQETIEKNDTETAAIIIMEELQCQADNGNAWTTDCKCSPEETTGAMWCCNICGKPTAVKGLADNAERKYTRENLKRFAYLVEIYDGNQVFQKDAIEEIIQTLDNEILTSLNKQ